MVIFPWLALFDFATVRANFIKPIDTNSIKTKCDDFAILVPIFNDIKYLANIDFLSKYANKVILCTTNQETEEFYKTLQNISKEYGFRISISDVTRDSKNPFSIFNKVLLAHDLVLKESIKELEEKYVIFIDGDTYVDGNLEFLCGAMEENDFDIASVKVIPSKRTNLIEHLQGVEYDIAMQARLIYPWLTSGAGMVAKRIVMEEVMKNHSLFFDGGDIEIGEIADIMGFRVGHIPMVFYTEIPNTFTKWVKQRFSWMSGAFRHSIINIHHNLNYPFHFVYFSFIIYFLYPVKVYELIKYWYLFPLLVLLYILITILANWKVKNKYMVIFPFYAFFQVMVIIWFGIWRYFRTVYRTGNVGFIRIQYSSPLAIRKRSFFRNIYNYSITTSTILLILLMPFLDFKDLWQSGSKNFFIQNQLYQKISRNENLLDPIAQLNQLEDNKKEENFNESDIKNTGESFNEEVDFYLIHVEKGDSVSKISRKAINLYIQEQNIEMNTKEKIYAEDSMKDENLKNMPSIRPGMYIKVEKKQVERHVQIATQYSRI